MKIRHKKPPVQILRPNVAWLMATSAMIHFCSYMPSWAMGKKLNNERNLNGKGGKFTQSDLRQENRWRTSGYLPDKSQFSARNKFLARLDSNQQQAIDFDIPPQSLASALRMFGDQAGLQFAYTTEEVDGIQASGVSGTHTPEEALRLLLNGTGMSYRVTGENTITVEKGNGASNMPMQEGVLSQESSILGNSDGAQPSTEAKEEPKPIKVPEVVVKDVVERSEGYKADTSTGSTRTALPIDETPTSIGVVTREIMQDTLSLTQNEAFEHVSGVSRSNTRLGRGEGFNIRGFEVGTFGGNFSAIRQNGLATDNTFSMDPALIERYEIIKGPASIAGGASSPGGVVDRITKKPLNANFATSQFQAGSFSFFRGIVDANGVLPQNEDLRGRLIFVVEDGGNFVDAVDVRQYTVAPSLEMRLFGGAGTLLLTGHYQKFDGSSYPGFPLMSNGEVPDIPRRRNFGGGSDNGAKTTFEGQNYELHYLHEFVNNLKLSAKGKYSHSDLSDKIIYAYTFGGLPPSGDTPISGGLRQSDMETYAGEIFLSKELDLIGQKHEVLLGVDFRDMNQDFINAYTYAGGGATDNIFNPANNFQLPSDDVLLAAASGNFNPRTTDLIQTGVFGQLVARPIPRLTFVGAFRYDWADVRNTDTRSNAFVTEDYSELTGRVGATYELFPGIRVYGGFSQSFQANVFNTTSGGSLLPPETGENYEVGAKLDLLDGRLRVTTALFGSYRQNVATADPINPIFSIAVGEQRHQGVEFDVNGQPWPGLNLTANFSYIDTEITEDNTEAFVGSKPTQVPRSYVGRIFATYELQSGPLQGLGFGGGVFFQSGFELQLPNDVRTDAYERVDAILFYRPPTKIYEFAINVRNLLDDTYIESPGGLTAYNSFGAPATVIGTLRVNFSPDLDWKLW